MFAVVWNIETVRDGKQKKIGQKIKKRKKMSRKDGCCSTENV